MNKRIFIGHCLCDSRFSELLNQIKNKPMSEVDLLYKIHVSLPANHRYNELENAFIKRLEHETHNSI